MASLSPRAQRYAFVAMLVLLYVLAFANEPGTFPEVLIHVLLWAPGFAAGWALVYSSPSPRRVGERAAKLFMAALAVAVLAVFFALPHFWARISAN